MLSDPENFSLNIEGYKFVLIGHCNPEQYDVYKLDKFDSTNPIGYVRLRFGNLTASCGKERIFYKKFDNEWKGEFSSDGERVIYLKEIADAIDQHHERLKQN